MAKKDIVSEIMNEGAILINNKTDVLLNDEISKSNIMEKKPSKKLSPKALKKIEKDAIYLAPEKEFIEPVEEKTPDINFEIEEVTRYDVNWLYLRQKLLEIMRLISYKNYENWFNESFNKQNIENKKLKNELIEQLKPENKLKEEWLNVESHEMDTLLKNFPSLQPQNHQKPIEKITLIETKSGQDLINIIKDGHNTKEQEREFLIQEIKRLNEESNLMKTELLNSVTDKTKEDKNE